MNATDTTPQSTSVGGYELRTEPREQTVSTPYEPKWTHQWKSSGEPVIVMPYSLVTQDALQKAMNFAWGEGSSHVVVGEKNEHGFYLSIYMKSDRFVTPVTPEYSVVITDSEAILRSAAYISTMLEPYCEPDDEPEKPSIFRRIINFIVRRKK